MKSWNSFEKMKARETFALLVKIYGLEVQRCAEVRGCNLAMWSVRKENKSIENDFESPLEYRLLLATGIGNLPFVLLIEETSWSPPHFGSKWLHESSL